MTIAKLTRVVLVANVVLWPPALVALGFFVASIIRTPQIKPTDTGWEAASATTRVVRGGLVVFGSGRKASMCYLHDAGDSVTLRDVGDRWEASPGAGPKMSRSLSYHSAGVKVVDGVYTMAEEVKP